MGLISILSGALTGKFNYVSALAYVFSSAVIIFLVLPFHEFAHAFAAHKLGDDTAKWQGRMSLNPMRHIDWIGAALIMAVGFGWAKPVPVNARKFKNPKGGMAVVALAGPVANLIAAFVSLLLCNFIIFLARSGVGNRLAGRACHTHVFALSLFVHGSNQRLPRRL